MQDDNEKLFSELLVLTQELLERGAAFDAIEKKLLEKHDDIVLVTIVLKEAKNAHYSRLRKQGFQLILAGSAIGLCGFLITLFNFNTSRSIDLAMYGFTSAGLAIVFRGLFKVIG